MCNFIIQYSIQTSRHTYDVFQSTRTLCGSHCIQVCLFQVFKAFRFSRFVSEVLCGYLYRVSHSRNFNSLFLNMGCIIRKFQSFKWAFFCMFVTFKTKERERRINEKRKRRENERNLTNLQCVV
jgi:hypothetical protein